MRDSYGLYVDKLQGEYKDTFQQIMTYVSTQNNDEDSVETQMGELLDTFLQAQEEGMPVSKIVGTDLESFCKNFCSQFGWENKLLNIVDRWKTAAWWILIISTGDLFFMLWDFLAGEPVDWFAVDTKFNLTGYLLGFVVVGLVYTLMDFITIKIMFKYKKDSFLMKALNVAKVIITTGCFILCFQFFVSESTNLLQLPLWILFLGSGAYLILYYAFNKERMKARKENKVSFWKTVQEQSGKDIDKTMEDKFAKKNKWRKRLGRNELTRDEFIMAEEKDCKATEKAKYLCIVTPTALCVWMIVDEFIHTGIENPVDLIFGVLIIFAFEAAFMYFLWKVVSLSNDDRMNWIKKEREKDER